MGGTLLATASGTVFPLGSVAGLSESAGERGIFGTFFQDEGTSRIIHFYTGQPSSQSLTMLARVRLNAAPVSPGVVMRSGNLSAGGTTIPLWRNGTVFDMRVAGRDYTGAGTWTLGQWYDIAIITTPTSGVMIVNGVQTLSGSAPALNTIEPTLGFGDVSGGGLGTGALDISFFIVCNRSLSVRETNEFFENPWVLYKAQPRRVISLPAGPIALPTLSGASFASRVPSVTLTY